MIVCSIHFVLWECIWYFPSGEAARLNYQGHFSRLHFRLTCFWRCYYLRWLCCVTCFAQQEEKADDTGSNAWKHNETDWKDNCIDGYLPYHEVWTDLRYYRRKWLWKNNVDASDCRTGKPQHRQAIVWWKEQSGCKLFLSPSLVRHRLSKSRWDRKRQQKSRKS